jgi:hypothetical protein
MLYFEGIPTVLYINKVYVIVALFMANVIITEMAPATYVSIYSTAEM